jgi:hypothetical protein
LPLQSCRFLLPFWFLFFSTILTERNQCSYALHLLEQSNLGIHFFGDLLDSPIVFREQGLEFFIDLVPQGELTPQEYDLFKIGWSHLGNPGVVVGSEARFLLQGMNLALQLRHLVV